MAAPGYIYVLIHKESVFRSEQIVASESMLKLTTRAREMADHLVSTNPKSLEHEFDSRGDDRATITVYFKGTDRKQKRNVVSTFSIVPVKIL